MSVDKDTSGYTDTERYAAAQRLTKRRRIEQAMAAADRPELFRAVMLGNNRRSDLRRTRDGEV